MQAWLRNVLYSLPTAALAAIAWISAVGLGGYSCPERARAAAPTTEGQPELKSIYSKPHYLSEFAAPDKRATVLVFLTDVCPVALRYMPVMRELHREYAPRGVQIFAIYCGSRIDVFTMAKSAHDEDLPFPAFLDVDQRLAAQLGVKRTPTAVVLDGKMSKVYLGAIDNQFAVRGQIDRPTRRYVRDALEDILASRPVALAETPASGCPIENAPRPTSEKKLTFHRDVEPILQSSCQTCHRQGGVGPFELTTYEDAYYNSEKIREVVVDRRMPPWHGELNPKYGTLANDKRLKPNELRTLIAWIDQGAAEGDAAHAPRPVQWPDPSQWAIGKPDYVYQMATPFKVPKNGILEYQFFRVTLDLPEDRWIQAVEVRPGNPEVVHHIALHLVPSGSENFEGFAGMLKLYGFSTDRAKLINDYVPGDAYNAKVYPAGQAVRIPKNSDLIFELHYTPNNRAATTDQSSVAFRWAKQPPKEEVHTRVFRRPIGGFRIPPFAHHYEMLDSYYFERDVLLDAVRPHFHLRGKSFRLEIVKRNQETGEIEQRQRVLDVPVWDGDWQRTYELSTPLRLNAGTELLATGVWDNSILNPKNPNPSATVEWGQQFQDEMFSTRFKYRVAPPESTAERTATP